MTSSLREQLTLKQQEVGRLEAAVAEASGVASLVKAGDSEAEVALAAKLAD